MRSAVPVAVLLLVAATAQAQPTDPAGPHRPWCKGPEPRWSHPAPCSRHHKFKVRRQAQREAEAAYVPPAPAPTPPAPPVAPVVTGGTPPDYIAACESGGSYTAVNPSSGAYGKWQILPSTSAAYGCDMSTPAGQDACAAEIYADVGLSAWVCG